MPFLAIDWEQRKLGDFSHKVTRKNESDSLAETFTNSAERGIVSQTEFFDKEISNPETLVDTMLLKTMTLFITLEFQI